MTVIDRLRQQMEIRGTASPFGALAADALREIERLQTRLDSMRQCFIDNTLRTTPSAKGTNIGQQIDEAVDRVIKARVTPNGLKSGEPLE